MRKTCPLLNKSCIEDRCMFWHELVVNVPGQPSKVEKKCVYLWLPILLIENAQETRFASASLDKVASELNSGATQMLRQMTASQLPALEKPR